MEREIRRADEQDREAIWKLFQAVVSQGEVFAFDPAISMEAALSTWMSSPSVAYVAQEGDTIVGSYMLKPNQQGPGSHVANAGFMVASEHSSRGIGRAMGLHALEEARQAGFLAMQYNFVVSTNERAVALWRSLGFEIIGTIPQGFRHPRLGLVDVYIMHRFL